MANTDFDPQAAPASQPASGLSRFLPALPPILRSPFELANVAERAYRLSQAQSAQASQPPAQAPGQTQAALPPPATPMPPPAVPRPPPIAYSYIPPKGDVPPENFGKIPWHIEAAHRNDGPLPPSQFNMTPPESYRYKGQAAGYFAKFGAPAVAGPAAAIARMTEGFAPILDFLSKGQFSANYSATSQLGIQRQLGQLKVQQEQYMLQSEILAQTQQNILERYGRVFTLATTMGKDGKPLLSGDDLHDAVRDIANEDQDTSVLMALDNGGLPQAIHTLQENQRNLHILQAGNVAQKKMTAGERTSAEIQAEYGETTDQSGQGLGQSEAFRFAGDETSAPTAAAPTEEAAGETNEFDEAAAKKGFTPKEIRDAHRNLNEAFDVSTVKGDPVVSGKINDLTGSLDKAISDIAAGPADDPDHPENSKIEKIRKIDKDYAADLEGLRSYDLDPNDASKKNRRHLANMTREVFPEYKEGFYKTYHTQWDNPSSPIGVKIQAANRASSQLVSLIRTINTLPFKEDGSFPADSVARILAGSANDPVFGEFNEAMGSFVREAIQTQTGSRGGSVSFVNQLMKSFNPAEGKAGLRAAVRRSVGGLMNITDNYNKQFQKDSGLYDRDMPGFDPEAKEVIQGVITGNPYNGKFSNNAPEELKMVSPFGLDPNNELKYRGARPSWWRPEMNFEPMDYSDYQARLQWLKEHPDDPRAPEVRQRLGSSR